MQPMRLCILSGRQFEDTFQNAQWRKVKQVQPMWLCIFSGRQFEDAFKNAQCYQCDFASVQAGDLRTHLKTHSGEKPNQRQAVQGDMRITISSFWMNVKVTSDAGADYDEEECDDDDDYNEDGHDV